MDFFSLCFCLDLGRETGVGAVLAPVTPDQSDGLAQSVLVLIEPTIDVGVLSRTLPVHYVYGHQGYRESIVNMIISCTRLRRPRKQTKTRETKRSGSGFLLLSMRASRATAPSKRQLRAPQHSTTAQWQAPVQSGSVRLSYPHAFIRPLALTDLNLCLFPFIFQRGPVCWCQLSNSLVDIDVQQASPSRGWGSPNPPLAHFCCLCSSRLPLFCRESGFKELLTASMGQIRWRQHISRSQIRARRWSPSAGHNKQIREN